MDPRSPTPHTGSLSVPPIKGSDQDPSQAGPTPTSRADFVRSWGVGRGSSALPGPVPRLQTHSPADGTASHDHDRVGRVPGDGPAVDVVDPGMVGGYPCGGGRQVIRVQGGEIGPRWGLLFPSPHLHPAKKAPGLFHPPDGHRGPDSALICQQRAPRDTKFIWGRNLDPPGTTGPRTRAPGRRLALGDAGSRSWPGDLQLQEGPPGGPRRPPDPRPPHGLAPSEAAGGESWFRAHL